MSDDVKGDRICEVLRDGRWVRVPLASLTGGDIFRLWDAEGVPALAAGGDRVEELSVALGDAFRDPDSGVYGVRCRVLCKSMLRPEMCHD